MRRATKSARRRGFWESAARRCWKNARNTGCSENPALDAGEDAAGGAARGAGRVREASQPLLADGDCGGSRRIGDAQETGCGPRGDGGASGFGRKGAELRGIREMAGG